MANQPGQAAIEPGAGTQPQEGQSGQPKSRSERSHKIRTWHLKHVRRFSDEKIRTRFQMEDQGAQYSHEFHEARRRELQGKIFGRTRILGREVAERIAGSHRARRLARALEINAERIGEHPILSLDAVRDIASHPFKFVSKIKLSEKALRTSQEATQAHKGIQGLAEGRQTEISDTVRDFGRQLFDESIGPRVLGELMADPRFPTMTKEEKETFIQGKLREIAAEEQNKPKNQQNPLVKEFATDEGRQQVADGLVVISDALGELSGDWQARLRGLEEFVSSGNREGMYDAVRRAGHLAAINYAKMAALIAAGVFLHVNPLTGVPMIAFSASVVAGYLGHRFSVDMERSKHVLHKRQGRVTRGISKFIGIPTLFQVDISDAAWNDKSAGARIKRQGAILARAFTTSAVGSGASLGLRFLAETPVGESVGQGIATVWEKIKEIYHEPSGIVSRVALDQAQTGGVGMGAGVADLSGSHADTLGPAINQAQLHGHGVSPFAQIGGDDGATGRGMGNSLEPPSASTAHDTAAAVVGAHTVGHSGHGLDTGYGDKVETAVVGNNPEVPHPHGYYEIWSLDGKHEIRIPYEYFHSRGLELVQDGKGNYEIVSASDPLRVYAYDVHIDSQSIFSGPNTHVGLDAHWAVPLKDLGGGKAEGVYGNVNGDVQIALAKPSGSGAFTIDLGHTQERVGDWLTNAKGQPITDVQLMKMDHLVYDPQHLPFAIELKGDTDYQYINGFGVFTQNGQVVGAIDLTRVPSGSLMQHLGAFQSDGKGTINFYDLRGKNTTSFSPTLLQGLKPSPFQANPLNAKDGFGPDFATKIGGPNGPSGNGPFPGGKGQYYYETSTGYNGNETDGVQHVVRFDPTNNGQPTLSPTTSSPSPSPTTSLSWYGNWPVLKGLGDIMSAIGTGAHEGLLFAEQNPGKAVLIAATVVGGILIGRAYLRNRNKGKGSGSSGTAARAAGASHGRLAGIGAFFAGLINRGKSPQGGTSGGAQASANGGAAAGGQGAGAVPSGSPSSGHTPTGAMAAEVSYPDKRSRREAQQAVGRLLKPITEIKGPRRNVVANALADALGIEIQPGEDPVQVVQDRLMAYGIGGPGLRTDAELQSIQSAIGKVAADATANPNNNLDAI